MVRRSTKIRDRAFAPRDSRSGLRELGQVGYGAVDDRVGRRPGRRRQEHDLPPLAGKLALVEDAFRTLKAQALVPESGTVARSGHGVLEQVARFVEESTYSACMPALIEAAERDPQVRAFHCDFSAERRAVFVDVLRDATRVGRASCRRRPELLADALVGPIVMRRLMFYEPFDPKLVPRSSPKSSPADAVPAREGLMAADDTAAKVQHFDGWYAAMAGSTRRDEIVQRHLGLPAAMLSSSLLPWEGIAEVVELLRLQIPGTLVDLGCGRGGYGLEVAARTGASLIGVDFSPEAIRQAEQYADSLGSRRSLRRCGHCRHGPAHRVCRRGDVHRRGPHRFRTGERVRRTSPSPPARRACRGDQLGSAGPGQRHPARVGPSGRLRRLVRRRWIHRRRRGRTAGVGAQGTGAVGRSGRRRPGWRRGRRVAARRGDRGDATRPAHSKGAASATAPPHRARSTTGS